MKSKIYIHLILLLMTLVIFGSCKKDIGNYNYKELNKLEEVKGLSDGIVALFGKAILVKPEIKFSQDPNFNESNYTYEWSYVGPTGLGGQKIFVLSNTKNLDMVMTVVAGSYTAYYSVTDKASGVKYTTNFTLNVVNQINEGWIMMNEANGKARVDMLSLNSSGNFDLVTDLLATTGSALQLEGKPVMTYTYNTGLLIGPDRISYGLYFGTDKGTTKVDPDSFRWTKTMGLTYEMFGDVPSGFYADVIQQRSGWTSYMIGKGNAYYYDRSYNIYYAAPINYIQAEGKSFEVAPFIGGNHAIVSNAHAIFYDKTNRRFVKHSGQGATCTIIPDPPQNLKLFSFSTGMDLKYMRWVPYNGGELFSILKDPNSPKQYLARFNSANNVQSYYSEITGAEIANAEFYAISPEFGYIFYAVGGKVYEYDMVYKTSKLMLDFGSKKVSYLNFYEFKNKTKYTNDNKLMVGIYDPAVNNGIEGGLRIYTVPGINADLVLYKSFEGFGRIKSLTYRER
ncbi:PKD-like family lipoprotein [Pedobacter sp.]|jgi:hypothetical protein|uniref:PKD-like family lipoprotein n=1 Tax=Pedobacter sp. TaxID=1411316 RepID=UPI002C4A4EF2|nr:PKD-like family lipoprotein [Pedobacter sp.]HWW41783.1 PKD-like family lipoprotein [Pedobacter sp.]